MKVEILSDSQGRLAHYNEVTYRVSSKSLTRALLRAQLLVEALGGRCGLEYSVDRSRRKPRHVFLIHDGAVS